MSLSSFNKTYDARDLMIQLVTSCSHKCAYVMEFPLTQPKNLPLLHFGHCYACFKVPQNSTHPSVHAWIDSWLNSSIFIDLNASYVVARSLFPFGSSSVHNKTNNSSMKLLLTPWIAFKLSNINKANNMEMEDLSNNGVEVSQTIFP
jgi:hypothetical protein